MKMGTILKILLVIALFGVAGIFALFYRFGSHDDQVLANFPLVYQKFDQAISDFSRAVTTSSQDSATATDELERNADAAQVELNTKASARISSLTRNDGDLMRIMGEIGDISGKELATLKAYRAAAAARNADMVRLAGELADLTRKRQTDYARFEELAGGK